MNDFPIELEETEAEAKLISGQITIECFGSENTYYIDSENNKYFCKNYPSFD